MAVVLAQEQPHTRSWLAGRWGVSGERAAGGTPPPLTPRPACPALDATLRPCCGSAAGLTCPTALLVALLLLAIGALLVAAHGSGFVLVQAGITGQGEMDAAR